MTRRRALRGVQAERRAHDAEPGKDGERRRARIEDPPEPGPSGSASSSASWPARTRRWPRPPHYWYSKKNSEPLWGPRTTTRSRRTDADPGPAQRGHHRGSEALAGLQGGRADRANGAALGCQGGGDDLRRGPKTTPRNKLTAAEEQRVLDSSTRPNSTICRRGRSSRPSPTAKCTSPPNRPSTASCASTASSTTGPAHGRPRAARRPSRPPDPTRSTRGTSRTCAAASAGSTSTCTWSSISGAAASSAGRSTTSNRGKIAATLVERICAANPRRDNILWLHSDNGAR
jgi:hypothetical protein